MPPMNGMQRIIHMGIPFWKNSENDFFAYDTETPPLKLGASGTLFTNWKELYHTRLESYRSNLNPRPRAQKK
jgi:hypothetical protein